MKPRHVFVSGRVQGVWYRAWTENTALELGLDGWVRNRTDGRVEAVIHGEAISVKEMLRRFHVGPPAARVDGVEERDWSGEVEPGFSQRETL